MTQDNNIKEAIVVATGRKVRVYPHKERADKWIDADNCTDEYHKDELKFK